MTLEQRAIEAGYIELGRLSTAFDCGYIKAVKDQIALDAKWIRENVGANVAVDFLKAMES